MWRFGDCGGRADRKAGEGSEFDEALGVAGGRTIYDAVVGNVHIGIIGGIEDAKALDDLGMSDVLCTSSVRAVREIEPKVVIAMGNVDGMVTDLKLTPRAEKKFKLKPRGVANGAGSGGAGVIAIACLMLAYSFGR